MAANRTTLMIGKIEKRRKFLHQVPYFIYFATKFFSGSILPIVAGISITDSCNLNCLHCWRKNQGHGHAPYDTIAKTLENLYQKGSRYLYIQGGEPCTWQNGQYRLRDIVARAKKIGFFHIAICTNGTFPLDAEPDSYSVSIEGTATSHDLIRSNSYRQVIDNIQSSDHPYIFINITLNRHNSGDLEYIARLVAGSSKIRGVLINFHIPYPGVEHLALTQEQRSELVERTIVLKKEGYPILNTYSGLRALSRNNWKRPLDLSIVTDCEHYYSCCRARGQEHICRECGYGGWAELAQVFNWDFKAIMEILRKFCGK